MSIAIFIINLKKRTDRLQHVLREFVDKVEFKPQIIEAHEHQFGAIGLWSTIKYILQNKVQEEDDFVIICEDDHLFTEDYSLRLLLDSIEDAKQEEADILLGGVSWMNSMVAVTERINWVEKFSGLQFAIVFKKFFARIIETELKPGDACDYIISDLSQKKFFIAPFISIQKDFGYSDVTARNNLKGSVREIFEKTYARIDAVHEVEKFYKNGHKSIEAIEPNTFDNITLTTYIINLPERIERRKHIEAQFENKPEFDTIIIDACKHEIGAVGLWQSIRKIIAMAIENDDDVIIICEDDHEFSKDYSKEYLFKNILEAHQQGIDYLSGGSGGFGFAMPISENRFWVSECLSTQFIVLYRKIFQSILDEPFDETVKADHILSEITANKILLFPFVSTQKDFGYSDVTVKNNEINGLITTLFNDCSNRLELIRQAQMKYANHLEKI